MNINCDDSGADKITIFKEFSTFTPQHIVEAADWGTDLNTDSDLGMLNQSRNYMAMCWESALDDGSCETDTVSCEGSPAFRSELGFHVDHLAECTDGSLDDGEICDDGNGIEGDGCSNTCTVEVGWTCDAGSPSVCTEDAPPPEEAATNTPEIRMAYAQEQQMTVQLWGTIIGAYVVGLLGAIKIFWSVL